MNFSGGWGLKGLNGALKSSQGHAQFELRVGPFVGNELTVVSFEGREALNEPFVYDVVFAASVEEEALQIGIFGFPACLSIYPAAPHEPRVIQGIAVGFDAVGAADWEIKANTRRYRVRIVPRLWLADQRRHARVFEGKTAIQIACDVLQSHGIQPDVRVPQADYPALPFEYQRHETDLDFVRRVLATAGIFFYFRHASGLLDQFVPGAGAVAGEVGELAGAASELGGVAAGVSGFVSDAESTLGLTTTLVLADRAATTEALGDTSLDAADLVKGPLGNALGAATKGVTGAATSAFGGAIGSAVGASAGAVGVGAGPSDALAFDGNGQAASAAERVYAFRLSKEIRPRKVNLRSWNLGEATPFTAGAQSGLMAGGVSVNITASVALSGFHLGAGAGADFAADALPIGASDVTVDEYQRDLGLQNVPREHAFLAAERALLQERSDWRVGNGETDCRRLAPGYRFTLQQHPIRPLDAEYLVVETRSRGSSPEHLAEPEANDYRCVFRCVPSTVDPKPKKPEPPFGYPAEPAIVIGPVHGDVHCDELGRIRVKFRWAGTNSGDGECWAFWADSWGGDGYGMQSLPRVGSEVVVQFLASGEPIATNQLRSRANMPAFPLPNEAAKVGIRSRTIPNGREQSEISIDDNAASEEILIRATGTFHTEVARDTNVDLRGSYNLEIAEERREKTNGDSVSVYAKDAGKGVYGNLREEVGKDRTAITRGSTSEWVGGDVTRSFQGRVDVVAEGAHRAVFKDDALERHSGHHTVVVAADDADRGASACVHVEGMARAFAEGEIEAVSKEGFTFSCGDSHIVVRKDSITISSPTITLSGKALQLGASDTVAISAKTATLAGSDTVTVSGATKATLAGQAASVTLDANATVQGTKVSLANGSGASASQLQPTTVTKTTTLRLTDTDGNPLSNRRVILRTGGEGGPQRTVVLDAAGQIQIDGSEPFEVLFPDVAN